MKKNVGKRGRKNLLHNNKFLIIAELFIIMILVFAISVVAVSLKNGRQINNTSDDDFTTDTDSTYYASEGDTVLDANKLFVDADEYFSNNSSVISVVEASSSEDVYNEKNIISELDSRGIDETDISYDYTIDGELFEEDQEASESSQDVHPTYSTYYTNTNNEVWVIYVINNKVMANPITYNIDSERNVEVLVSENEYLTSYDCVTNKFYETIPNESELLVIKVDAVNSSTLNELTVEEIDKRLN